MKHLPIWIFSYCTIACISCVKSIEDIATSSGNHNSEDSIALTSRLRPLNIIDTGQYVFFGQEDFNGTTLDTSWWEYYQENTVRGYAKVLRENVVVSDGTLKLYAKKVLDPSGNPVYSSSMLSTQNSFNQKYGYFEVRAKVNNQVGPHCAFWILQHSVGVENTQPNPSVFGTEIDVFEYLPVSYDRLTFGLHWNGYNFTNGSHRSVLSYANIPGISTGFHTFALEWNPKEYIVFVDGIEMVRTNTAISHVPEFLILSTEIVGYGGDPSQMSISVPDVFEVDYVKVFGRKPFVTVYGECDYYGWTSSSLVPGNYTSEQLASVGIIDNDASSIEVPAGWTVTAFDGNNFNGDFITVTSDARCAPGFDNKMSSLKITAN